MEKRTRRLRVPSAEITNICSMLDKTTGIATSAALRALPTQLDLFTAVVGGGGVGGIVGGAVAWLLDKDLARGGILGGVLGLILGALLAILQATGLYS